MPRLAWRASPSSGLLPICALVERRYRTSGSVSCGRLNAPWLLAFGEKTGEQEFETRLRMLVDGDQVEVIDGRPTRTRSTRTGPVGQARPAPRLFRSANPPTSLRSVGRRTIGHRGQGRSVPSTALSADRGTSLPCRP